MFEQDPFSGGSSLQADHVTWGDVQFTLAPKLRKDGGKKVAPRQRQTDRQTDKIGRPGYGSSGTLGTVHPMRDTRSPGLVQVQVQVPVPRAHIWQVCAPTGALEPEVRGSRPVRLGGPNEACQGIQRRGVACTPIQIDSFIFAKCGIQPMPGLSLVVGQPSHAMLGGCSRQPSFI